MAARRFPLPKRFNAALSNKAYANLRALNGKYNYGNNYLLTLLLENSDRITTMMLSKRSSLNSGKRTMRRCPAG